jgi:putative acetyltransferase
VIAVEDPRAQDIAALLEAHLAFARRSTPPEAVHALEGDGLAEPRVTFFSYRRAGTLLGIAALRELDPAHAEIKSMHTAAHARGQGVAGALLAHLLEVARARGYRRISLETGAQDAFGPARSLYASAGFTVCDAFGGYPPSKHSTFMSRSVRGTDMVESSDSGEAEGSRPMTGGSDDGADRR